MCRWPQGWPMRRSAQGWSGYDLHSRIPVVLVWPGPGRRGRVRRRGARGRSDVDKARLTSYVRRTGFPSDDAVATKRLLDDAEHATPLHARRYIDAARTVAGPAIGKPAAALDASRRVRPDQLPDVAARMLARAVADFGWPSRPHGGSRRPPRKPDTRSRYAAMSSSLTQNEAHCSSPAE